MSVTPDRVAELFVQAFGRQPTEAELSGYLCRVLLDKAPESTVWAEMAAAAGREISEPLMSLYGDDFVRAALRAAGRHPAEHEIDRTVTRLLAGEISKRTLLEELRVPVERQAMFHVPLVGRFLRLAALLWNLPAIERELEALRHQTSWLRNAIARGRRTTSP